MHLYNHKVSDFINSLNDIQNEKEALAKNQSSSIVDPKNELPNLKEIFGYANVLLQVELL